MPNILSLVYRHFYTMFTVIFTTCLQTYLNHVSRLRHIEFWKKNLILFEVTQCLNTSLYHIWRHICTIIDDIFTLMFEDTRCKDIFKQILFTISNSKTCSYTYAQFFLLVYHIVAIFRRFSELFLCVLLHCTNIALKKNNLWALLSSVWMWSSRNTMP